MVLPGDVETTGAYRASARTEDRPCTSGTSGQVSSGSVGCGRRKRVLFYGIQRPHCDALQHLVPCQSTYSYAAEVCRRAGSNAAEVPV